MRYIKRPKYKLNKLKISIPKDKEATPEEIYNQMLMNKIKRCKKK